MKKILWAMVIMIGLVSAPRVALAGCTSDLVDCYERVAAVDSFWYRWATGIDCELSFADCTRRLLLGR